MLPATRVDCEVAALAEVTRRMMLRQGAWLQTPIRNKLWISLSNTCRPGERSQSMPASLKSILRAVLLHPRVVAHACQKVDWLRWDVNDMLPHRHDILLARHWDLSNTESNPTKYPLFPSIRTLNLPKDGPSDIPKVVVPRAALLHRLHSPWPRHLQSAR